MDENGAEGLSNDRFQAFALATTSYSMSDHHQAIPTSNLNE
jgi:hypothetical protein